MFEFIAAKVCGEVFSSFRFVVRPVLSDFECKLDFIDHRYVVGVRPRAPPHAQGSAVGGDEDARVEGLRVDAQQLGHHRLGRCVEGGEVQR